MKCKLKIDHSLDAFPMHGVGGILGTAVSGGIYRIAIRKCWLCRSHGPWKSNDAAAHRCSCDSYLYCCGFLYFIESN
ncbi:MAG: hypothetical protein KTR16_13570 [Acidiferrobacterales bacterium]|nr:hypothetical protein [Acidiferrobacterales bacterium]